MWDNRATKRNPKQPDYKCKNKQCDKAVWVKADEQAPQAPTSNGNGNGAHRPATSAGVPLSVIYGECMEIASRAVKHYCGANATPQDIVAATATLFIQAAQTGRPVKAPARPAAPPPPPPKPPEPVYDPYEDERSLPF